MANIRHMVVIRKDLNLSPGLMAAQVAHINDAWLRELLVEIVENDFRVMEVKEYELEWCKSPYLSVLAVDNYEELAIIIQEARDAKLEVKEWFDLIPSVNLNRPIPNVAIGCSIGPDDFDKIKAITGTLPLA